MARKNIKHKTFALGMLLALFLLPLLNIPSHQALIPKAEAATSSSLNSQKTDLLQKITIDGQQITAYKSQLPYIQQQISQLNAEIASVKNTIAATQASINTATDKIAELKTQIDEQQAKFDQQKRTLSNLVADWYMQGGDPGLTMTLIGADSLSDMITMGQYYASVKDQIQATIVKINELKKQLADQKAAQEQQLNSLNSLKADQVAQQKSLQSSQYTKNQMYTNTQSTISRLQSDQADNQKKLAQVQAQIDALSATKMWGTQIVSSNDSSWYYQQTGNGTYLGDSPYTVAEYGCLITSIAMVATFYGQHVTPTMIAENSGNFNYGGYLQVSTPYPVSDIVVSGSQAVNWSTVNSELDAGHPVIVSIYLPSVGAINSDGSSHFIVIKSHNGSQYYMHDPIAGQRGYDTGQVRSMKIVRPL